MLLLGETSDTLCQFARDSKSKACDSPDLRQNSEFFSFLDPFRKKYVVSKMENIVKNKFVLHKLCVIPSVRYIKCMLNWCLIYKDK